VDKFYVYIIASPTSTILYKGFSTNPFNRLVAHNSNLSNFTSSVGNSDWQFVFIKSFHTKKEALIFEKKIKKWNRDSLDRLINSSDNQIKDFI
jgi:putative endonuclease